MKLERNCVGECRLLRNTLNGKESPYFHLVTVDRLIGSMSMVEIRIGVIGFNGVLGNFVMGPMMIMVRFMVVIMMMLMIRMRDVRHCIHVA